MSTNNDTELPQASPEAIEDKLNNIELHKILNRVFLPNPDWKKNKVALKRREFRMRQIKDIQAIITTETTKAREDELEKAVQQFIFNTHRNPHNFSEYATVRLAALQKDQHD